MRRRETTGFEGQNEDQGVQAATFAVSAAQVAASAQAAPAPSAADGIAASTVAGGFSTDARQWHLDGTTTGLSRVDLNVRGAWADYGGRGVSVGVYDDGIDLRGTEFTGRYNASRELAGNNASQIDARDAHGMAVAGLIGAARDGVGMTGVAWASTLTAVDIFRAGADMWGAMTTFGRFDVTNHSWGWVGVAADNQLNSSWRSFFFNPIEASADFGRGGLGTINVVAGGNDRHNLDNTNLSGFTSMRETITVGAVTDQGFVSWYSNPGVSNLVVAPSNGGARGIATTDVLGAGGYAAGDVTTGFGGTSAAAPQVAGVVALMLEANRGLGWRDVQEILAYSARHVGSDMGAAARNGETDVWAFNGARDWNGGGLHYSADYGFGLVDATAAVRLAETWRDVSTSANETVVSASLSGGWQILDNRTIQLSFSIARNIDIEHVRLEFGDIRHTAIGNLDIEIISARGTRSIVLDNDGGLADFTAGWRFLSQEFRGEESVGTWTVRITDTVAGDIGSFTQARLDIFGDGDTTNDTYIYTNEYARFGAGRTSLVDSDGGRDIVNAAAVTTDSVIHLGGGASTIAGRTTWIGTNTIEIAYGGDGNDTVTGNSLANELFGGRGNDRLDGATGNDILVGGAGNDWLIDGDGADRLTGGAGADVFQFAFDRVVDTVTDFVRGQDRVALDDAAWRGVLSDGRFDTGDLVNVSAISNWLGTSGFVFAAADQSLYFFNGSSAGNRVAQFTNVSQLSAADFLVV